MTDTESAVKELAKEMFVEGYKRGRDTETFSQISRDTAEEQFERFWEKNR